MWWYFGFTRFQTSIHLPADALKNYFVHRSVFEEAWHLLNYMNFMKINFHKAVVIIYSLQLISTKIELDYIDRSM